MGKPWRGLTGGHILLPYWGQNWNCFSSRWRSIEEPLPKKHKQKPIEPQKGKKIFDYFCRKFFDL